MSDGQGPERDVERRRGAFPVLFFQMVAVSIVVAGTVTALLYLTFDRLTEV